MDGRNEGKLNSIIKKYLKKYDCCIDGKLDEIWLIKKSPLGGFGVFANRNIEPGEVIFFDHPVLLGPRCLPVIINQCSNCYSIININKCEKNCGLLICGNCLLSEQHLKECKLLENRCNLSDYSEQLTKCLTPLRSLLLSKEDLEVITSLKSHKGIQHGQEIQILTEELNLQLSEDEKNFLYFICTVLDANAFEVSINNGAVQNSVRGLYPLGSLTNHRCFPNVFHVFDEKQRMVVRASVYIPKDTEIFNSYTRLLWGTITRGYHLKNTKHFLCKCDRCKDSTEFNTYLTAVKCRKCPGKLLPINPLQKSNWQCETCNCVEPLKEVANKLSLVGSVLKGFKNDDFEIMYRFLTKKLPTLMPDCNQVAVELKYKIIWILGHEQGFFWHELSLEHLQIKRRFCIDILEILEKLQLGKCTIRGLLSYELYLYYEEIKRRQNSNNNKINENESNYYFLEAADILKYDTGATAHLKQKIYQVK